MAEYSVVSPSIENYTPTTTTVSGQITEDTEITVVYYLEKYTVKFMSEGREFYSVELNYGDIIELPNNIPVKAPGIAPVPLSPAPELGQHTYAVLQELLHLDEEALTRLAQSGVI